MNNKVNVPEEAVEDAARAEYESVREPHMLPFDEVELTPNGADPRAGFRERAAPHVHAAAPAIRSQERQRVREALMEVFDERLNATEEDALVAGPKSAELGRFAAAIDRLKEAALNTLEDPEQPPFVSQLCATEHHVQCPGCPCSCHSSALSEEDDHA